MQAFYIANMTLTMTIRGLGLPTEQYLQFSNLLAIITKGESTCTQSKGGFCNMLRECSYYSEILNEYSFLVKF